MRIGLFGGSFDPIHRGHIEPVKEACQQLSLDRVIYLPTAVPPHKLDREFAPPYARFAMVELALLEEEKLVADPFELTPSRPAYSVDSVEHFRSVFPGAEIYLLIGGDSFAELNAWHRWRDLVQQTSLGVLVRPDWDPDTLRERVPREVAQLMDSGKVSLVANQPVAVSATKLRDTLASGAEPPPGWMPDLVLKYIRKYAIYQ